MTSAPSGIAGSIGWARESAYGTGVAPTDFVPMLDESLELDPRREASEVIRPDRLTADSEDWGEMGRTAGGAVSFHLMPRGLELLLEDCFGSVAEVDNLDGSFDRTFTPGFLTGKSLAWEVNAPKVDGTANRKRLLGGKVSSWEIAYSGDADFVGFGVDLVGQDLTFDTTAPTAAAYLTGLNPLRSSQIAATFAGGALKVRSGSISGDNPLAADRWHSDAEVIDEPLDNGRRTYGGDLEVEFSSLDQFDAVRDGTEVALVETFTAGANLTLTITRNVKLLSGTPSVAGRDLIVATYDLEAVGAGSDGSAITAVLVNDVAI